MELSVIVPVYNMAGDGKLAYCMDSLVRQTLQDLEIIAVDDASTDDSLEILRAYEQRFPGRVKVVASPENRRQGGARNLGLDIAQGRYVGFLDSDDWAAPDMFEAMLHLADETGADVVGCDLCLVHEHTMIPTKGIGSNDQEQVGRMDHDKRASHLLKPGSVVTKIYAREIFEKPKFRFPENMQYEDNASFVALCMRMKQFAYLPQPKYFYYQREGSTTHSISMRQCEDRMESMRIMLRYAKENGALEEFRDEVEYQFTTMFYRTTLFSYMQSDLKKDPGYLRRLGEEMEGMFPEFRKNPYYQENADAEEKKYIDLQLKSTALFLLFYQCKQFYRKIRYARR